MDGLQIVGEQQTVVRERPSYTPTIVVSIFFGLVGLWPAIRHSRMARERGYSTGGYWWAFGVPVALAATLSVAFTVLTLRAADDLNSAALSTTATTTSGGGASQTQTPQFPPESQSDGPAVAAKELAYDWVYAYGYIGDSAGQAYLANAYSCTDSSCGYSQAAAQIGTARLVTNNGPRIVVNQATATATGISATTTAYVIGAQVVLTFQAVWTGTHWGATSLTSTGRTT
jgi:hypothetical protein